MWQPNVDIDTGVWFGLVQIERGSALLGSLSTGRHFSIGKHDLLSLVDERPYGLYLAASKQGVYFAVGEPEKAKSKICTILEGKPQAGTKRVPLLDFFVDAREDSAEETSESRRKLFEAVQDAIFDTYLNYRLYSSFKWDEARNAAAIAAYEQRLARGDTDYSHQRYTRLIDDRDFLRSLRKRDGRPSFSHWLDPESSRFHLTASVTPTGFSMRGELGTSAATSGLG